MPESQIEQRLRGGLEAENPKTAVVLHDDGKHNWRLEAKKRIKHTGHTIYDTLLLEKVNAIVLLLSAPATLIFTLLYLLPILSSAFVTIALPITASLFLLWLIGTPRMKGYKKIMIFTLLMLSCLLAYEINNGGDILENETAITYQLGVWS